MDPDTPELDTLEGIRETFLERFKANGVGFHALGEAVAGTYWERADSASKPVSAMTFRNFLQGRTTLRDPTGLLLYFETLGATDADMRRITMTLQQEVDRRLAAPTGHAAMRAFKHTELDAMPYTRALVEVEAATRFEESISAPLSSISPTHYLLGPSARRAAGPDPAQWGLLHHLQALHDYFSALELALEDDFAAHPRRDTRSRSWSSAAGLREALSAFASWMLHVPGYAELMLSSRRYLLHGPMPETERQSAIALTERCARALYHALERFAQEVILGGDPGMRAKSAEGELALERVGERLVALATSFYVTVVIGSVGTGATFRASYQSRREFGRELGEAVWSQHHQALIDSYDEALERANSLLESDARVPYGDLKAVYEDQARAALPHHHAVWERDYASQVVRTAASLTATELHRCGLMTDREFLAFQKTFFTTKAGRELCDAVFAERRFQLPRFG